MRRDNYVYIGLIIAANIFACQWASKAFASAPQNVSCIGTTNDGGQNAVEAVVSVSGSASAADEIEVATVTWPSAQISIRAGALLEAILTNPQGFPVLSRTTNNLGSSPGNTVFIYLFDGRLPSLFSTVNGFRVLVSVQYSDQFRTLKLENDAYNISSHEQKVSLANGCQLDAIVHTIRFENAKKCTVQYFSAHLRVMLKRDKFADPDCKVREYSETLKSVRRVNRPIPLLSQ